MNRNQRLHQRLGFSSMIFFAPEKGGTTGSEKPPTLEEKLALAEKARDEHKASLEAAEKARDAHKAALDAMTGERDTLQRQFDALKTAADQAKTDLTTAQDALGKMTTERDSLKTQTGKDATNIVRLEALCGIKGVDKNGTPPAIDEPQAGMTVAAFDARLKAAKTPKEAATITAEFEKAITDGKIK